MTTTAVHDTCPGAVEVADEATRVMDRLADALAAAPERGCATPAELVALAEVTGWIADDQPGSDPRRRLRWLVLSGLERSAGVYAAAADGQPATVELRTGAPDERQWAASTVAALLAIRLTAGTLDALVHALGTVVEHAGPDDLWSLLTETARTWGHLQQAATRATG